MHWAGTCVSIRAFRKVERLRKFCGVTYSIEVANPKSKSKDVKSLVVDGQKIAGNVIPLPTDGRTAVKVEVTLGA